MRVDKHQRRPVPDAWRVVKLGLAVRHPGVGQPRHELDVGEQRDVRQPLRETLRHAAAVGTVEHEVRDVRRAGLRAEEQVLHRRDHGRWNGVDLRHAQPVRHVRQARRVERFRQHQIETVLAAAAGAGLPQQQVGHRRQLVERVANVALVAALRHQRQHLHRRPEPLDHVHCVRLRVHGEHGGRVDLRVVVPAVAGRQRRDHGYPVSRAQRVQYRSHVLPVASATVRFDRQYPRPGRHRRVLQL